MYVIEIEHHGLKKHRVIRGRDRVVVERKAELQRAAWDEQWAAKSARLAAAARTSEAQRAIEELRSILSQTLEVDDLVDWESLKRDFR